MKKILRRINTFRKRLNKWTAKQVEKDTTIEEVTSTSCSVDCTELEEIVGALELLKIDVCGALDQAKLDLEKCENSCN